MRIFIIGATGHTGTQLVDLALARGHSVTAFVRNPAKLQLSARAAQPSCRGDPHDVDALAAALPGHDVGLLGARRASARRVPPAHARRGVRGQHRRGDDARQRAAAVSGLGGGAVPDEGAAVRLLPLAARSTSRAISRRAEEIVRATPLDWTIARPPRLTGGSRRALSARASTRCPTAGARCRSARSPLSCSTPPRRARHMCDETVGLTR